LSPAPLLFRQARLLDPANRLDAARDLLAVDGRIAAVGGTLAPPNGATVIEANGLCLAPGLVDMRTQLREPGAEHEETLATAAFAAVAGGVTTIACLANTNPIVEEASLAAFIARKARQIRLAKIYPYAAMTRGRAGVQLTEMGLLDEEGVVGFTDAPNPVASALVMRRALSYAQTFNQLILSHPEEPSLTQGGAMNEGEIATRLGLPGIPATAELIMVERDILLAELTRGRLHVGPLSTAASIEVVRQAKRRGVRVTADTAPHYFSLNETAVGEYRTFAKVSPPLRNESDRRAVIAGLADGTIDAIASDHSPHDPDSKRLPFIQASFGIVGLETLLPLSLELYHQGHIKLPRLIELITSGPADIIRRPAGTLSPGAAADLVLFDLDRPHRIDTKAFHAKSKNSPFDGRPVQGSVVATYVDGRAVFQADTSHG
jgi:dihydroorotase